MRDKVRKTMSFGIASKKLKIKVVAVALALPSMIIVFASFSSEPAQAGWWGPRILVTDGADNLYFSNYPAVATDIFRNVHIAWFQGGDLDGSGPDSDIFYRKWNATTQNWEKRVLITDDNLNNTEASHGPDVETDSFGNVHVAWQDNSDLDGVGFGGVYWKMWDVKTESWGPRLHVSYDNDTGYSGYIPRLAADPYGNIHLAFTDREPPPRGGIQYRKWNGTTRTWEERMTVSGNSTLFGWSDIAVDPYGNVHIAWNDAWNFSGASSYDDDIFYRRLDASSKKWGPIFHVNDDDESDVVSSNMGSIASDVFGNVHIVWEDLGGQSGSGPDEDIFYRKWNVTTRSWDPRVLISNDPANTECSSDAQISTDSLGNVHVVWVDKSDVDGAGTNYGDIFYKKWNAVTGVWEHTISLTNDLDDQYLALRQDIASDNLSNVVIVWCDGSGLLGSGPDGDIYLRRNESDIVLPDYLPIDVSPSPTKHVLPASSNLISVKVYNGGNTSNTISTIAFYNFSTPSSPFFIDSNVPPLRTGERTSPCQATWIAPSVPRTYRVTILVDYEHQISELSEANNYYTIEFIVESPPPPPTNLTTEVVNDDDIFLNWTASDSPSLDHYLIYRSTDQREFDFPDPIYNTSTDIHPLRTNYTDNGAASSTSPKEYYYTVRSVSELGMMSITSNTAGKRTKTFSSGLDTFSLPLEPFEIHNISWYANNMPNTTSIRWMDSTGHWVTHYKGTGEGINDVSVEMGKGYEIFLSSDSGFTFCGYPASMIRYQEGLGDSIDFRKSLSAQKDGSDTVLSWDSVTGASWYKIFRSNDRIGLHNLSLQAIGVVPSTQNTWTDYDVLMNEDEHYYTVIPVYPGGKLGSSTYSVGVSTIEYQSGSDTFALPLKTEETHSLDWYCDEIPKAVGVAYLIFEVWKFHAIQMLEGIYDVDVLQGEGYQISTEGARTRFTFIGY
jgi:hypothetical protein